jgi:hypothetical protein
MAVLGEAAVEHRIDVFEHGIRADVGQESEPPAIDAEQGHGAARHQVCGVEQRAVPADRDDEVGARRKLQFRAANDAVLRELEAVARVDERPQAAGEQMRGEAHHTVRDPHVLGAADEGNGLKRVRHRRESL